MLVGLDLDRYPLDRPGSAEWKALVEQCQAELAQVGMFNLEGLMKPGVAQAAAGELAGKFRSESFRHTREHNIFFAKSIAGLPDDHPALARFHTSNYTLCGDQVTGSPVDHLYHWPHFATFLAAAMNKPALHTMDDALSGLNVMSYREGQRLNWHFDRSEFTTTILLQAAERGGDFLYRTGLGPVDDPDYDGIARLLRGEDPEVRSLTLGPGTLNVFRGRHTPHKVSPVSGGTARVVAVFAFFEEPGARFTDEERIGFYGRSA